MFYSSNLASSQSLNTSLSTPQPYVASAGLLPSQNSFLSNLVPNLQSIGNFFKAGSSSSEPTAPVSNTQENLATNSSSTVLGVRRIVASTTQGNLPTRVRTPVVVEPEVSFPTRVRTPVVVEPEVSFPTRVRTPVIAQPEVSFPTRTRNPVVAEPDLPLPTRVRNPIATSNYSDFPTRTRNPVTPQPEVTLPTRTRRVVGS